VPDSRPTAAELRAAFEPAAGPSAVGLEPSPTASGSSPSGPTVGLEEEVMLLDRVTLDLAPHAAEVVGALEGDPRFKVEMPAAQLEIVTGRHSSVGAAVRELAAARRALADSVAGRFRIAGAGAHPFASGVGPLNPGPRYQAIGAEYATVAQRQLVFGLHVHVAVRGPERALAVYNALRSHLPELAALAANAPFYEEHDSGLASVRSRISGLLPRQGIPPALESWEAYAEALRWAPIDDPRQWWWELRLHPSFGTVEVRVPDTQATIADTAAVAAVVYGLANQLAARHDAGESFPAIDSWRIDQNRWAACRHGAAATMTDPVTGERYATRDRLAALLEEIAPHAPGCTAELDHARALLNRGGAARQRALAAEHGLHGLVARLADEFAA
jgi:carboxylate-amine ligase